MAGGSAFFISMIYTSIAARVEAQSTRQAANRLLSIRVSNFMAILRER